MSARERSARARRKTCPYCAERIREEAIKCRYCGSDLGSPPAPDPETASDRAARAFPPWLGAGGLVMGTAGGLAEVLQLLEVKTVLGLTGSGESPPSLRPRARPFGPLPATDTDPDRVHFALIAVALAVGLAGFAGGLLLRRGRARAAAALLAGGALGGGVATLLLDVNAFVVALSALMFVAAIVALWVTRGAAETGRAGAAG